MKPNVGFIRQLISLLVTVDEVVVVPLFGLRYTALSHHTANIDQGHVSGVFIAFDLRYHRFLCVFVCGGIFEEALGDRGSISSSAFLSVRLWYGIIYCGRVSFRVCLYQCLWGMAVCGPVR